MRNADECCGGAGIYGMTHPELGGHIGRDKVEAVRAADAAFGGTGDTRPPSPYELGVDFIVPRLCVREAQTLYEKIA